MFRRSNILPLITNPVEDSSCHPDCNEGSNNSALRRFFALLRMTYRNSSAEIAITPVLVLMLALGLAIHGCSGGTGTGNTGPNPGNPSFSSTNPLTADDVRLIIQQAVTEAVNINVPVTVAVVDRGGNVLGVFQMTDAPNTTVIGSQNPDNILPVFPSESGLELLGLELPGVIVTPQIPPSLAAISKAGTAAFLSTSGNAFTPLTASDIIQQHRPVGISFTASGPLFGVQFSSLPCTDIKNNPPLPLGLAGDPGAVPLYKDGEPVGAIGVEGALEKIVIEGIEIKRARYTVDLNPFGSNKPPEEIIAVAGSLGFEAPKGIRADTILLDGVRLPFVKVGPPRQNELIPFNSLPGNVVPVQLPAFTFFDGTIRGAPDPNYGFESATIMGLEGRIAVNSMGNNRFPFQSSASGGLTAADVETIIGQAVEQAYRTRAAIRQPAGSFAEVNVAVVDENGVSLGYFGTPDAPFFGFDVSVQKARTAAFFSGALAGIELSSAGFDNFVQAAMNDGIALDGSVAFSDRGLGFLHRPFFPDDIDGTASGPFSRDISIWSPFNVGLQLDLDKNALLDILTGGPLQPCTTIDGLENGLQIFAGSVPLYKNGILVGAIGVSGDGIDQDDLVAATGSKGFESPPEIRSDTVFVRGARLPFVRFPRNPER